MEVANHANPGKTTHPVRVTTCLIAVTFALKLLTATPCLAALAPARLTLAPTTSLSITGAVGTLYAVQYTTNLNQPAPWHTIALLNLPATPYVISNTAPARTGARFYRAVAMSRTNMILIPAGAFVMGSPTNEVDRSLDESPQTTVTFTLPLWMGTYHVTQQEFLSVTGLNPSASTNNLAFPVDTLSWDDATNYCILRTQQELASGKIPGGFQYRLPTEAEWEYACRAGTTTRFNYGDDPGYTNLVNHAWYSVNSGGASHLGGQKPANAWGLYDMHGNLYEWCQDYYGTYPGGSVTNYTAPPDINGRVLRGGSWDTSIPSFLRSAFRIADDEDNNTVLDYGFRVVLAPIP